ncbi:hypothetical protein LTR10_007142 [Elasticomyces elasticus]|nr:hypothetical protein LTR10_007142 [Elasticomyces elasticus]KAK4978959.1 hypothetical protein LTR42_001459 [Elasticomyces elasticus]
MGQILARPVPGKSVDDDEMELENGRRPASTPRHQQGIPTRQDLDKFREDCNIQPHTDEGGDAYYIGDAYEESKCAKAWTIENDGRPRPYLDFIKRICKDLPHLEYLAHWMEVTCAPPKWKFIEKCPTNREERAAKCKVCVLDFEDGKATSEVTYENTASLDIRLNTPLPSAEQPPIRLIISEDLSRDVVELLGSKYDIDPLFFRSHIDDYLFHNTRDPWVELPDLDVVTRQRCHFNVQYLRARYFKTDESFKKAEQDSGSFNVLRRLDSDRSRRQLQNTLLDMSGASVTLTRSKTSLWVKPRLNPQEPIVAILLVDPTVSEGHPQWGGYNPFSNTPSMHSQGPVSAPSHTSLFDDVIYWSSRMSMQELAAVRADPRCVGVPMLRLVLADWRTVEKYMTTMLAKLLWEFENPHWAENPRNADRSMAKLSPWRRNMPYYQQMIAESIDRVFQVLPDLRARLPPSEFEQPRPMHGLPSLLHDFRLVQQLMAGNQQRIEMIQNTASDSINIEESRLAVQQNERAVQQNQNLARLTFLATIFIPLNFTSSFLSMSPDFKAATQTIWMFFAIGVPLTIFALVVVDLSDPQKGGVIRTRWRASFGPDSAPPQTKLTRPRSVEIGQTIRWPMNRLDSSYRLEGRS